MKVSGKAISTEQAEARTEEAEARTEEAEARTEQAEARTEQAEARTEQAEARIEQAEARTERAEARADRIELQSAEALRALESELEQRVIDRTQELEAFSYTVSHDLRVPLSHIVGIVKALQKDAGPSLSERNLAQLTTLSKFAKQMGGLIEDLLAFSRIGKSEVQKTQVDLNELVQDSLGDFLAETQARKIVWTLNSLPSVPADRALLRLALVNLFANAIKFTSHRAEAKIEIGSLPNPNEETVIFIRDNGAGFDPVYTHKLFGAFQRLHNQDEFEGTGLGLANVQRIINRHGGRVWAEGAVDEGATFYFAL